MCCCFPRVLWAAAGQWTHRLAAWSSFQRASCLRKRRWARCGCRTQPGSYAARIVARALSVTWHVHRDCTVEVMLRLLLRSTVPARARSAHMVLSLNEREYPNRYQWVMPLIIFSKHASSPRLLARFELLTPSKALADVRHMEVVTTGCNKPYCNRMLHTAPWAQLALCPGSAGAYGSRVGGAEPAHARRLSNKGSAQSPG